MFRAKYILLFFGAIFVLETIGYFFYRSGSFYLNDKFIFGLVGGNTVAIIVSALLLIVIYWLINSNTGAKEKSPMIYYWILAAGVFSNTIERIFYGGVVDYITLPIMPTFNLADILIIFSLILIFAKSFR